MALTEDTPGSAATLDVSEREERGARLGRGLVGAVERHACRHQPVGDEPEVDVLQVHERAGEEHRRDGEHERQGHLHPDQRRPRPAACAAAGDSAGRLERTGGGDAAKSPARRQVWRPWRQGSR